MKLSFLLFALPFLILIALASLLVFKSWVAYGLIKSPLLQKIIALAFTFLPIILVATMILGAQKQSLVNTIFYNISVLWLPLLLYLALGSLLIALYAFVANYFSLPFNGFALALSVLTISLLAIGYGIWNAATPRVVSYTISSESLNSEWSGKRIVLVSDTHLGIVRSEKFMKKVTSLINKQSPDLVLIAGDLIDGPVFSYERGLAPLASINVKDGIVYTPGNHEQYNTEPSLFYPTAKKVTTLLEDQKIIIRKTAIIGLRYTTGTHESIKAQLYAAGYSKEEPTIVLLHDPKHTKALMEEGVALSVSGHTHCGQFFPLTLIVRSIYKEYTYGLIKHDSGVSITTCGVGTAMSPIRIGTYPEIAVLTIR